MEKSCGVIIKNVDGDILIAHPTNDFSGENIWVFPKGGIDVGESEKECALREVWEETDLKLENIKGKLSHLVEIVTERKIYVMFLFESEVDLKKYKLKCNSIVEGYEDFEYGEPVYEMDSYKWLSPQKCLKYLNSRERKIVEEKL